MCVNVLPVMYSMGVHCTAFNAFNAVQLLEVALIVEPDLVFQILHSLR